MEPPGSSSTAGPATLSSRACLDCSKAKAKCVPQAAHNKCTRCSRLGRECIIMSRSTRKRRSPNVVKNTTELEKKVDSLVALLSDTQEALASRSTNNYNNHPLASTPCENEHADIGRGVDNHLVSPSAAVEDSDYLLNLYREYYEPEFPFIVIPPSITSKELKAQKPWLAKTIGMVASHENRARQLELAKEIIMEITGALLMRCERNLDILEALIIYNAWQFYYASMNAQFHSMVVVQLALAVLFDLGLNRPLHDDEERDMVVDSFKLPTENAREVRRSSEERRAFLSCFVVSSSLSRCVKQTVAGLENTPYLEYTCQSLFEAAEFESDLILGLVVKSQSLVASVFRNLPGGLVDPKAPPPMQAELAKAELQKYFMALPPPIQGQSLVARSYHSAIVFFYETSLHRSLFSETLKFQRLNMLYTCLTSSRSVLDTFLALPLSSYHAMSTITLSQLNHSLSTIFKLSIIHVQGWDLTHVREDVKLVLYFDAFISRFREAGAQIDHHQAVPVKKSFCTGAALAMERAKGWYEASIVVDIEKPQQIGSMGGNDPSSRRGLDYFDDASFMGDWTWEDLMRDLIQE